MALGQQEILAWTRQKILVDTAGNLYNYRIMMRLSNAMTKEEVGQLALKVLRLSVPMSLTAGEVATAIQKAGDPQVTRDAVKRALEFLLRRGEAMCETKTVVRNGFTVQNAAHYYAPRDGETPMTPAAGCGQCAECLAGERCSVFAAMEEAEKRFGGRR